MNFTKLVQGPEQLDQDELRKYSHYMVIVLLSDEAVQVVIDAVGFELETSAAVLCFLIKPVHLRTAAPGTVFARLREALGLQRAAATGDHSFFAIISREELLRNPDSGGKYVSLSDLDTKVPAEQKKQLRREIGEVLRGAERIESRTMRSVKAAVPAAAALVAGTLKVVSM